MLGETISHYRITRHLGGGGMGIVYEAEDLRLGRLVALKFLPGDLARDEEALERFEREARSASALNHPHICTIHDIGWTAGDTRQPFIVMERLEGETLKHLIGRGRVQIAQVIDTGLQIADALATAHAKGIIHRDIKPANIFLTTHGEAKILDFGIAKLAAGSAYDPGTTGVTCSTPSDQAHLTRPGSAVGTIAYMSPEQALGEDIDGRSDLFSLGVVLYEMTSGLQPFTGGTTAAIFDAILHKAPEPLHTLDPNVAPDVDAIVARLLEKDRAHRYGTAADLKRDLVDLKRRVESGHSHPASARRLVGKTRAFLAIALVTLAGSLGLYAILGRVNAPPVDIEKLRAAAAAGDADQVFSIVQGGSLDLATRSMRDIASRMAGPVTVDSVPSGADVSVARLSTNAPAVPLAFHSIGSTPVSDKPLVAGEYVVRLQAGTSKPAEFLLHVKAGEAVRVTRTLPGADAPDGFAVVPDGPVPVPPGGRVAAFQIGTREVTNAEFLRFVSAGGYRDARFWPATIELNDQPRPWTEAVAKFVDRTGVPGPRVWSGGTYPVGQSDHPVVGVGWYEASAYARFMNMQLPGWAEWWRAALGDAKALYPWGNDVNTADVRANFGLVSTAAVGSHPSGMSPFGCYDMAGNVREWLSDAVAGTSRRRVVGGSWQDPSYMFEASHAELFDAAFANDSIGFRLMRRPSSTR